MAESPKTLQDFAGTSIAGRRADYAAQRGKVFLFVNTASQCGFTPQLQVLEQLWKDHAARGLVVVGYPCNQFGGQDPESNENIAAFCSLNHGVTFPMMAKVEVNGPNADPLWQWLKQSAPGALGTEAIKWNFTKFLVGRDGRVKSRHAPATNPEALRAEIEAELAQPSPA
jgi:glutathione peroxidase